MQTEASGKKKRLADLGFRPIGILWLEWTTIISLPYVFFVTPQDEDEPGGGGFKGIAAFIGNTKVITFERLISMTLHHKSYIYHLSTLQMINTFMDITTC